MATWYTGKPCHFTNRSHVNMCVFDSTWEDSEAFELDHNPLVEAWVKNDHLGVEVLYVYRGVVRKYRPDFLIRFKSGNMLVLETKGQEDAQSNTKRAALKHWTQAINQHGGFGRWSFDESTNPGDIKDILARHARATG
jgi:type III restriction enzyme